MRKEILFMADTFLFTYSAQEGQGHPTAAQGLDI